MSRQALALVLWIGAVVTFPLPVLADWAFVGENPDGDRFHVLDESVTELTEGVIVFDTLINYKTPQSDGSSVSVDRFVAECRTGRVVNVSWIVFGNDDQVVDYSTLPSLQTNVAPTGTLIESEIQYACQVANR